MLGLRRLLPLPHTLCSSDAETATLLLLCFAPGRRLRFQEASLSRRIPRPADRVGRLSRNTPAPGTSREQPTAGDTQFMFI